MLEDDLGLADDAGGVGVMTVTAGGGLSDELEAGGGEAVTTAAVVATPVTAAATPWAFS